MFRNEEKSKREKDKDKDKETRKQQASHGSKIFDGKESYKDFVKSRILTKMYPKLKKCHIIDFGLSKFKDHNLKAGIMCLEFED